MSDSLSPDTMGCKPSENLTLHARSLAAETYTVVEVQKYPVGVVWSLPWLPPAPFQQGLVYKNLFRFIGYAKIAKLLF